MAASRIRIGVTPNERNLSMCNPRFRHGKLQAVQGVLSFCWTSGLESLILGMVVNCQCDSGRRRHIDRAVKKELELASSFACHAHDDSKQSENCKGQQQDAETCQCTKSLTLP